MLSVRKSYIFRFIVIVALCSAFVAGLVYFFSVEKLPIKNFDYSRDTKPILKIFDKDWYWLVAGATPEQYSPDFMLKNRTPDRNPKNFGKLIIKVVHKDGKLAGFTVYFKKTYFKGKLLYLGVAREFRGKGYGRKLTEYAIKDLFSRGCLKIELVTRVNNPKARGLYKKLGFKQTAIDDTFVYYELKKK